MSNGQNTQVQTYEGSTLTWRDLGEWSATFASGIVDALGRGSANATDQLIAVTVQYQTAITSAIVYRDKAIAAGDEVAEAVWRQASDEMSRVALLLADEAKPAVDRLATFQGAVNDGLHGIGHFVGPAFDIFSVADAIRSGDGNKAGEAVLAIGLGAALGSAAMAVATFVALGATATAFLGGIAAVGGAISAEYVNPYTSRPFFDFIGSFIPDGFWHSLESSAFGEGAARLDPTSAVYVSMLLHRIDNNIQLTDLGEIFDSAASARQGRETVALLNALARVCVPDASALSDEATDEQIIAFAGRIASITDRVPGAFHISVTPATVAEARDNFSTFMALYTLSPVWVKTTDIYALAVLQTENGDLALAWQADYDTHDSDTNTALNFSDQWYEDRAAMLEAITQANVLDVEPDSNGTLRLGGSLAEYPDTLKFIDKASNTTVIVGPERNTTRVFRFDNDESNPVFGGLGEDHLYGGGGNDTLEGFEGNDYLEGGEGNDTLIGGKGNDKLVGGKGVDTYIWNTGDGYDIITELDEDDNDTGGRLKLNGHVIGRVVKDEDAPSFYKAHGFRFSDMSGNKLRVYNEDGDLVLTVENFNRDTNNMGLIFDEDPDEPEDGSGNMPRPVPPTTSPPPRDPFVIDLDGDGLETVGIGAGILFDHGNDGIAENSGWVGEDDALLVRDLNGDGKINNGSELFGNFTQLKNGGLARDGYAALADLDSNGDGFITADDVIQVEHEVVFDANEDGEITPDEITTEIVEESVFSQLRLWQDRNQNGQTDAGELLTLEQVDINAISVNGNYRSVTQADGNILRGTSVAMTEDGRQLMTGIYDFEASPIHRAYTDPVVIPPELKSLPTLTGMGQVRDLREAAALSPEQAA